MTQSLAIALASEVADAAAELGLLLVEHANDETALSEVTVNIKSASTSLTAAKDALRAAVVDQRHRERTGTTQPKREATPC